MTQYPTINREVTICDNGVVCVDYLFDWEDKAQYGAEKCYEHAERIAKIDGIHWLGSQGVIGFGYSYRLSDKLLCQHRTIGIICSQCTKRCPQCKHQFADCVCDPDDARHYILSGTD